MFPETGWGSATRVAHSPRVSESRCQAGASPGPHGHRKCPDVASLPSGRRSAWLGLASQCNLLNGGHLIESGHGGLWSRGCPQTVASFPSQSVTGCGLPDRGAKWYPGLPSSLVPPRRALVVVWPSHEHADASSKGQGGGGVTAAKSTCSEWEVLPSEQEAKQMQRAWGGGSEGEGGPTGP